MFQILGPKRFKIRLPTLGNFKLYPRFNNISITANIHTNNKPYNLALSKLRNIGVIAHIDAGKTTTTERLLLHSGIIKTFGNVDSGTTTTDYLPMERERGITIQSACITLSWLQHKINLIDTPGHIDFTVEVERSLRVIDGVVVVIDGNRGIQPQTTKVWKQSDGFNISKVVFINKLDRNKVDWKDYLNMCFSFEQKFGVKPLVLQLPIYDSKDVLVGVVDLINEEIIRFNEAVTRQNYNTANTFNLDIEQLNRCKLELLETLAELDDIFLNLYLEDKLTPNLINQTVRKLTLANSIVPILCGSSLKDVGIQSLLDSIIHYLPSPKDLKLPVNLRNNLELQPDPKGRAVALVFKVLVDNLRGNLTFVRVYSGAIAKGTLLKLANDDKLVEEKVGDVMQVYSDELEPIPNLLPGEVGILLGLKEAKTGDTLFSTLANPTSKKGKVEVVQLENIQIPKPVFAISVELESLKDFKELELQLNNLTKEDPSLKVNLDKQTGQTLLLGMGTLHLEVVRSRLQLAMPDKLSFGEVQVAYKEKIDNRCKLEFKFEEKVLNTNCKLEFNIELRPIDLEENENDEENQFLIEVPRDLPSTIQPDQFKKLVRESLTSCSHRGGPQYYPLIQTCFTLSNFVITATTPAGLQTAVNQAYNTLLQSNPTQFVTMEPTFKFNLKLDKNDNFLGKVLNEVTNNRSGSILQVEEGVNETEVHAIMPLSKSLDWIDRLRSLTKGNIELESSIGKYMKSNM